MEPDTPGDPGKPCVHVMLSFLSSSLSNLLNLQIRLNLQRILQMDLFYIHISCRRFIMCYNNYLHICHILEPLHWKTIVLAKKWHYY